MRAPTWMCCLFNRKSLIDRAILRRFTVTLAGNEGAFAGVLVESDGTTFVFADATTDKNQPIAGRVYVDRARIAYLQEVTT